MSNISLKPGSYVAFEGGDGAGKTTNAKWLASITGETYGFEPGGNEVGMILRDIVKDKSIPLTTEQQVALFMAARGLFAQSNIEAALKEGSYITDRTWMSTAVYQGEAGGFPADRIEQLALEAMKQYTIPTLTLVLEVDPNIALERRIARRVNTDDRFKSSGEDFLRDVFNGYRTIASRWVDLGRPVVRIDAGRPLPEVRLDILRACGGLLVNSLSEQEAASFSTQEPQI